MIQKHNRHMSFFLYIAAFAVSDTAALISGMFEYCYKLKIYKMMPLVLFIS